MKKQSRQCCLCTDTPLGLELAERKEREGTDCLVFPPCFLSSMPMLAFVLSDAVSGDASQGVPAEKCEKQASMPNALPLTW